MKKLAVLSLLSCLLIGSFAYTYEMFFEKTGGVVEDMPMLCLKCGKYHKPTTACPQQL